MRAKIIGAMVTLCVVGAAVFFVMHSRNASPTGGLSQGHGIKCLKADGMTPCVDSDVSSLNKDIVSLKSLVTGAKQVVGDAKTATGDAQQTGADGKQLGSDARQLGSDAKSKNLGQGVGDAKQATGDAETATSDAKQLAGDAQQVAKDLKGIGNLSLKSPDGALNCVQDDGSACSDEQTKALQIHAAQMQPPLSVKREVSQPNH